MHAFCGFMLGFLSLAEPMVPPLCTFYIRNIVHVIYRTYKASLSVRLHIFCYYLVLFLVYVGTKISSQMNFNLDIIGPIAEMLGTGEFI